MKPRCARGKREVGDANKIPIANAGVMLLQSIERTPQQTGSELTVDAFCSSESEGARIKWGIEILYKGYYRANYPI